MRPSEEYMEHWRHYDDFVKASWTIAAASNSIDRLVVAFHCVMVGAGLAEGEVKPACSCLHARCMPAAHLRAA